jgi:hypothetical protein
MADETAGGYPQPLELSGGLQDGVGSSLINIKGVGAIKFFPRPIGGFRRLLLYVEKKIWFVLFKSCNFGVVGGLMGNRKG